MKKKKAKITVKEGKQQTFTYKKATITAPYTSAGHDALGDEILHNPRWEGWKFLGMDFQTRPKKRIVATMERVVWITPPKAHK